MKTKNFLFRALGLSACLKMWRQPSWLPVRRLPAASPANGDGGWRGSKPLYWQAGKPAATGIAVTLRFFRRALSAAVLVALAGGLVGCVDSKRTEPALDTNQAARPKPIELSAEDAAALQPVLDESKPKTEADVAWKGLEEAMAFPSFPPQWLEQPPADEELNAFQTRRAELMAKAADAAKDFHTRFPSHEKAAEARQREYEMLSRAVQLGQTNRLAQLLAVENVLLKDPKLPEDAQVQLRVSRLMRAFSEEHENTPARAVSNLEKGARMLQKDFPKREDLSGLLVEVAGLWLEVPDVDKAKALAQEVADGTAPQEAKESAQLLLKKLNRVGRPLAIKFKAVDGREVDLQAMKGKVVLVDFWATWCVPCMQELPNVKAAYDKLHPKGFEIVGISFDQDKEALLRVTAQEKMPWPQYFGEGEGDNKFGEEFGIDGIPAMWLVDKKGMLRHLNARDDLAGKVEKLLVE